MNQLMRFPRAVQRAPEIEVWMAAQPTELGALDQWLGIEFLNGFARPRSGHDQDAATLVTDHLMRNIDRGED